MSSNNQENKSRITTEITELAGLFAADGSMQGEHICFWGNPKSDRDFYDKHIKNLFLKAFDINIRPHDKKSNYVYGFYICDKKIINFFNKKLGFPIGNKTYSVKVPDFIYKSQDKSIVGAFIRGFFAGDGCLNFDKRYANDQKILKIIHTYPRMIMKCVSKRIIDQLSNMLSYLEIRNFVATKRSKKKNEVNSYALQISGKEMLRKWTKKIGFPNRNHTTRYEIFKKYGFVPSNTTYDQRIKILEGKLDPWSFYPRRPLSLVWIRRQ